MFSIHLQCPHCSQTESFNLYQPTEYRSELSVGVGQGHSQQATASVRHLNPNDKIEGYGVASCPKCSGPVLISFESNRKSFEQIQESSRSLSWRYTGRVIIKGTWPKPVTPDDSPHYPQALRAVFVELQEDVARNRTPARIVSGCRSVLEVALRTLGYQSGNLVERIDRARAEGLITESMKRWAHKVRIEGDEVIHELTATSEEAQELVAFLRLFLEIVFILPNRIPKFG